MHSYAQNVYRLHAKALDICIPVFAGRAYRQHPNGAYTLLITPAASCICSGAPRIRLPESHQQVATDQNHVVTTHTWTSKTRTSAQTHTSIQSGILPGTVPNVTEAKGEAL